MDLVKRFDVYLSVLDPTRGSEIRKTRPCLIVSPDEMNRRLPIVIVAPLTSTRRTYPSRIPVSFDDKDGDIALEQLRTLDKIRLVKLLGRVDASVARAVSDRLVRMFAFAND